MIPVVLRAGRRSGCRCSASASAPATPPRCRPSAESRRGDEVLQREFPGADTNPIVRRPALPRGQPARRCRASAALYDLSRWIAARPTCSAIDSIVDLAPGISREQYIQIAAVPAGLPAARPRRRLPADGRRATSSCWPCTRTCRRRATRRARWCGGSGPSTRRSTPSCSSPGQTAFDLDFIDVVRAATPGRDRLHRGRHLPRAVPAAALGAAAAQGHRDEPAVDHRLLRRAGVDLPGRPPGRLARLHARRRSRRRPRSSCSASSSGSRWTTRCCC